MPTKNYTFLLVIIVVLGVFMAGCTQSSGTVPVTPALPVVSPPPTGVVTIPVTTTPQEVVTVVRQVSRTKDLKDSELLFSLQVPVEWDITSYRMINAENTEGLLYRTDLENDDRFTILTYAITRGQDQAYRDGCRMWLPAPVETSITMNGITYDRFESTANGRTNVTYVVRKASANERGYASVLSYSSDTANPFEKEDFETVIASFRYFSGRSAGTVSGEEIPRILATQDTSGGTVSGRAGSRESSVSSGCSTCRG